MIMHHLGPQLGVWIMQVSTFSSVLINRFHCIASWLIHALTNIAKFFSYTGYVYMYICLLLLWRIGELKSKLGIAFLLGCSGILLPYQYYAKQQLLHSHIVGHDSSKALQIHRFLFKSKLWSTVVANFQGGSKLVITIICKVHTIL